MKRVLKQLATFSGSFHFEQKHVTKTFYGLSIWYAMSITLITCITAHSVEIIYDTPTHVLFHRRWANKHLRNLFIYLYGTERLCHSTGSDFTDRLQMDKFQQAEFGHPWRPALMKGTCNSERTSWCFITDIIIARIVAVSYVREAREAEVDRRTSLGVADSMRILHSQADVHELWSYFEYLNMPLRNRFHL